MPAAPSGRLIQVCRLAGHEERVWNVAWRPNKAPLQLASCGEDRTVRVWGQQSGSPADSEGSWRLLAELETSTRHSRTIRTVAWDPTGTILACASFDATTTLWREVQAGAREEAGKLEFECVGTISGHENEVKSAAFSPSGEFMATCSRDKSVWIFDTSEDYEYECLSLLQSHTQDVKMLKWHPEQDVLFSCSYDDTVKIWGPDGDDWSCKETLAGHDSTVWSLAFDAKGTRLASCSDDGDVRIWAPADQVEESKPDSDAAVAPRRPNFAAAAFISPLFRSADVISAASAAQAREDAAAAAAAPVRRTPRDASCSWRCVTTIKGEHPRAIYSVDWLPFAAGNAQDSLASSCGDNHVRVFQPRNGSLTEWACVADVEAHLGDANCVAWCPEALPCGGALLATAGDDAEVVLWRFVA